jgi:hypothetical protein
LEFVILLFVFAFSKISIKQFWSNFRKIKIARAGRWWLMPVILATEEAKIRQIVVWSQLWTCKTFHKKSGVAQGEGPEFKP